MNKLYCGALLAVTSVWCLAQGKTVAQNTKKKEMTLTSPAFEHEGMIPKKYTCDGENISPALQWQHAPAGTQTFALIVDDPDAPKKTWVHWVVFNIPGTITSLPEGVKPSDFAHGATDFSALNNGDLRYGGPCPPRGTHHYHFTLYALDKKLTTSQGVSKMGLLQIIKDHILAQAELVGLYAYSAKAKKK